MRSNIIPWILSLALVAGTGSAFADTHRGNRNPQKTEQRAHNNGNRPNSTNRPNNGHHNNGKHDKDKYNSAPRPGANSSAHSPGVGKPAKPVAPVHKPEVRPPVKSVIHRPAPRPQYIPVAPLPMMLSDMVAYATRGCSDVNVWQIDNESFIVRFRQGPRYYTQMIYPYSQMYGPRNTISVGWRPSSPWTLIPSVNLNINL